MNVEVPIEADAIDQTTTEAGSADPTASNRTAVLLNRIALVLAFGGIFVAGILSVGHALALSIPCGENGGCEAVANSAASRLFGVPVAYLGLGVYLALATITSIRGIKGLHSTQRLGHIALGLTGVGAVFSFYLQFVSLTQIQAYCLWCIASAVIMCLAFLVQAGLAQTEIHPDSGTSADIPLSIGLALASALALGAYTMGLVKAAPQIAGTAPDVVRQLVTPDSIALGDSKAPIKVIEFSDLLCPSCRAIYPQIKRIVETSNGKVQLLFRHYPLHKKAGHEMALPAAFVAEYANEKGKGWEFIEKFYEVDVSALRDLPTVLGVAQMIGLDVADIEARMKDDDPAYRRVTRDMATAKDAGITSTPTFVLMAPGQPPKAMLGREITTVIREPAYQKIIEGNGD